MSLHGLVDHCPERARVPIVMFQWRGSLDGIAWSDWRYFTEREIDLCVIITQREGYAFIQARKLQDGFEVERCPIQTWEEETNGDKSN